MARLIEGRPVVPGEAVGSSLFSDEPLSFWGGYDAATGEIIDRRHPLAGLRAEGRVLVIPATRGSSTTTAVLLEAVRRGTAPAALITRGEDRFLALAAIVAKELYGRELPVVAVTPDGFDELSSAAVLRIDRDGGIEIRSAG